MFAYNAQQFDTMQARIGDNTLLSDFVGLVTRLTDIIPSKANQESRRHIHLSVARARKRSHNYVVLTYTRIQCVANHAKTVGREHQTSRILDMQRKNNAKLAPVFALTVPMKEIIIILSSFDEA